MDIASLRRFVGFYLSFLAVLFTVLAPYMIIILIYGFLAFLLAGAALCYLGAAVLAFVLQRRQSVAWFVMLAAGGFVAVLLFLSGLGLLSLVFPSTSASYFASGELLMQDGRLTPAGRWNRYVEQSSVVIVLGALAAGAAWIAVFHWARRIRLGPDSAG